MTESYLKNGITLKFLTRRIKTVYVPFVIMMLCEVLADKLILGKTLQLKYMIPAILGWVNYMEPCIDSTMWYITFLLFNYLLFMCIFFIKKIPDCWKVIAFVLINVLLYACKVYLTADWLINYFAFPLGILMSYGKKLFAKLDIIIINNIALACLVAVTLVPIALPSLTVWAIYGVLAAVWCITFVISTKIPLGIFRTIGKVSYMVYLVEGAILFKYGIFYFSENQVRNFCTFFIVSVLAGALVWLFAYRLLPGCKVYINKIKGREKNE